MRRVSGYAPLVMLMIFGSVSSGVCADVQKKLEDTVQNFYKAYSQSKWKTAEQYVDPESREIFRVQPKPGIMKYQLKNIELRNGDKEAIVTVAVDMPVEVVRGQVLTLSAQTQWKLQKGKWQMVIGSPPPYPAAMAASSVMPVSDKPTSDLQFDYREFDFGQKRQGDVVNVEFPFVNVTDHPVKVTASLVSFCKCIDVRVDKETVAPGEKASVQFKLDSNPFTFYYHQGIGVKVEPGNGSAILDITGFLLPLADNPVPQPTAKKEP